MTMNIKAAITAADRLQRKVQELCRLLQTQPHGALLSPAAAFLISEAREEAFTVQKEIAAANQPETMVTGVPPT